MAGKAGKRDLTQKKRLEKEITGLLSEIEEEGLVFLLKQANTLIHNQRTVRINDEIRELNSRKPRSSEKAKKSTAPDLGDFTVEISRSDSGKTYYFVVNGRKHFFDVPETQKIVELCYKPETKSAALKMLYEFFNSQRDEILLEHGIKSKDSPFFTVLFTEVRSVFTLN